MIIKGNFNEAEVFTGNIDDETIAQVKQLLDQEFVEDLNINYGKEKKLDYYPDEYNYFNDHNNYFFYYYPTRVEKIDERRYLVDIETSDIPTKYATELIYYQII